MGRPAAKRSLGQNFLVDHGVVARIVQAAGISADETVIEIGPGRGALTPGLRGLAGRLVCIEKDDELAPALAARFANDDGAKVVHGDALKLMPADMPFPGPYRVIANLPYNMAARITMHLLEDWGDALTSATLMYQLEVAERLAASPSTKAYGALSVLVQSFCEVWPLFQVPPGAFRPVPKVQSAVVRIARRGEPMWQGLDYDWFRKVVHAGFYARRKTLVNSLRHSSGIQMDPEALRSSIERAGIDPERRGDSVSVLEFVELARVLAD